MSIDLSTVLGLARLELRAALRNWWFVLYALVFSVLAGGVGYLSTSDLGGLERGEFGRTAAGLVNVVLLVVPLFGLLAGAVAIAGDRERGLLAYYLAQPISAAELFWGKYLGTGAALAAALSLGFGVSALTLARSAALDAVGLLSLAALAGLLLLASLSIGMLISTVARRSAPAVGAAVFAWVGLLFLGDLGLMASAVATRLDLRVVVVVALLNPAELFKVASVQELGGSLDALGPAGNYLVSHLGAALRPLLVAGLLAWITLPTALAAFIFRRSDAVS